MTIHGAWSLLSNKLFSSQISMELLIAVRIAGGDLVDALGQQVPQGMINIGLMSFIMDSGSEALGQANLTIDPT